MPYDVSQFFEQYCDAYNRLDGRKVASHCAAPFMISDGRGQTVYADDAEVQANMVALCGVYRDSGFARAEFVESGFMSQNDDFCVADLAWTIHRETAAPQRFNTSYQLAKRDGEWKIVHVTAYSEKRFWAETSAQ